MGLFGNNKKNVTNTAAPIAQQQATPTIAQPVATPQPVYQQPQTQQAVYQQVPGQVVQQTPVQQVAQTTGIPVTSPTQVSVGANQTQIPVAQNTITNQPISASLQTPEHQASAPTQPQQHAAAKTCLLYTSPSPRDKRQSRMPSSA